MAKTKYWWSQVIAAEIIWWKNYPLALEEYKVELEVTDPQLLAAQNDSAMFVYVFAQEQEEILYAKKLITYRRALIGGNPQTLIGLPPVMNILTPPAEVDGGMMFRTFAFIRALRDKTGFTTTIAEALKVVGADIPPFDGDTFIAKAKGITTFDGNKLSFTKGPYLDGVGYFRMRGEETEYSFLDKITTGTLLDNELNLAPGPETRWYIARGFINNAYVGSPCVPFSLTWTSPTPPPPPALSAEGAVEPIDKTPPPAAV